MIGKFPATREILILSQNAHAQETSLSKVLIFFLILNTLKVQECGIICSKMRIISFIKRKYADQNSSDMFLILMHKQTILLQNNYPNCLN